uniref:Uncharacterized protein n=1 Tax=Romanomermis culicivorax TaxID=13658 RepID=A0A915JLH3_ROMCU
MELVNFFYHLDNIDNPEGHEEGAVIPVMRPTQRRNAFELHDDKQFYTRYRIQKAATLYCSRHILKISSHPIMVIIFEKSFFNKT